MDELRHELARHVGRIGDTARPQVQSFGAGLRRIREDNGMAVQEIADLLEVSTAAVTVWESDDFSPVLINLDKLCAVLPELRIGIDIGAIKSPPSRDIPKPIGRSAEGADAAPAVTAVVDELAERRSRELTDAFLANVVPSDAPEPDAIVQLSEAYGHARLAAAQARRMVISMSTALDTARAESEHAAVLEAEALAVLDLAIAEELNA